MRKIAPLIAAALLAVIGFGVWLAIAETQQPGPEHADLLADPARDDGRQETTRPPDSASEPVRARAFSESRGSRSTTILGTITGDVSDSLGDPIADATVTLLGTAPAREEFVVAETRTDGAGAFAFSNVETSRICRVDVRSAGHETRHERVRLTEDEPARVVHVTLGDGVTVRGRVMDTDGERIRGATVLVTRRGAGVSRTWNGEEATTGVDGEFEIAGAPTESVEICAWAPGRAVKFVPRVLSGD